MSSQFLFRAVTGLDDPTADEILAIYTEAFPSDQRMSRGRLASLLAQGTLHLTTVSAGGRTMGFAAWLRPPGHAFAWLEYLAVRRGRRGGGIGSSLFTRTMRAAAPDAAGVLIEVEPPELTNDRRERIIRRRRIEFYEHLGCRRLVGYSYKMWSPDGGVPMLLLLYPGSLPALPGVPLHTAIDQAVAQRRAYYDEASHSW